MNYLIVLALLITSSINAITPQEKQDILTLLSCERYFPYQDILVNNEAISKGVGPDCPSRYDSINNVLKQYKRPIKVLDIGASNGYFSLRIAHDYPSLCIMVDLSDRLCKICELNTELPNLIYLKRALSLEDLQLLNAEEHFDVVLALNVVHHMEPWKEILDVIFELGDTVIVETPPANDDRVASIPSIPLIEQYLLNKPGGKVIQEIPRAAANNFDQITTLVETTVAIQQKEYTPNAYAKMFCFEKIQDNNQVPSFKVTTFNALDGKFPSPDSLHDNVITMH